MCKASIKIHPQFCSYPTTLIFFKPLGVLDQSFDKKVRVISAVDPSWLSDRLKLSLINKIQPKTLHFFLFNGNDQMGKLFKVHCRTTDSFI